jgi:multiple sugar transport system permease protein
MTANLVSRRPRPKRLPAAIILYVLLVVIALIIIIPFLWVVLTSFKTNFSVINEPANPIPDPFTLDAYHELLTSAQPILRWFGNSVAAAVLQTAFVLITASCGAYALARLNFPGKRVIFGCIIATLFVPPVILLIPNYLIVQNLGWLDTIWAITVPHAAGAFGIFFLRQFFLNLPSSLEEAARIDGAGDFRIFTQIVLPLSRPALATLAILAFLGNWNDFLWPLYVLLTPENLTLQPGLSILQGAYGSTYYPVVMAGAVIASVPVLILFTIAQRQVVESVANSGLKG